MRIQIWAWLSRLAEALALTGLAVLAVRLMEPVLGESTTRSLLSPLAMLLLAVYRPQSK